MGPKARGAPSPCPICGGAVVRGATRVAGEADPFPFCSSRCQLVDLGKWLGDEYRIPDRETVVWPPDAVDKRDD